MLGPRPSPSPFAMSSSDTYDPARPYFDLSPAANPWFFGSPLLVPRLPLSSSPTSRPASPDARLPHRKRAVRHRSPRDSQVTSHPRSYVIHPMPELTVLTPDLGACGMVFWLRSQLRATTVAQCTGRHMVLRARRSGLHPRVRLHCWSCRS